MDERNKASLVNANSAADATDVVDQSNKVECWKNSNECQKLEKGCGLLAEISDGILSAMMIAAGNKRKRKNNGAPRVPMRPSHPPSGARCGKQSRGSRNIDPRVVRIEDAVRLIKYGSCSRMDAKDWKCNRCHNINRAERYLIADLPPFSCLRCKGPINEDYEFSFTMARALVNGSCPIGNIKDQADSDECTIYATCSTVEIADRMSKILLGETPGGNFNEGPVLDTDHLRETYENMMIEHGINKELSDPKFNSTTLLAACDIAVFEGIRYLDDKNEPTPPMHKAPGKRI